MQALHPLSKLCHSSGHLLQLSKAKEGYSRWQGLSRSSPDYGSVRADVEDECKSIAWQAGLLLAQL